MCGPPVGNLIIDGMHAGMMDRKSKFSMKSILWAVVMHGCAWSVWMGPQAADGAGVLIERGASWEYLLFKQGTRPEDPGTVDGDFHSTWHTPANYDGPTFNGPGPALLGYGTINAAPIATNINGNGQPQGGRRYTTYFRTTFTPSEPVDELRFTGIVDDGCVIYINGSEVGRINMGGQQDRWLLLSGRQHSESANRSLTVQLQNPLQPFFEVDVAISLHNQSNNSSDMGLDLQIESLTVNPSSPPENDDFVDACELTGPLPIVKFGRTDDLNGSVGATKEVGEPNHAGNQGGASVWFEWTATIDGEVTAITAGSSFDTLLGVYTGATLSTLVEIGSNDDISPDVVLTSSHRFEATAGVTYYFAVDGKFDPINNVTDFGFIEFVLTPLAPQGEEVLVPFGGDWKYLLHTSGANVVQDPAVVDANFHRNWHWPELYDGPVFSGPAPAPLGYGQVSIPIVTDVWGQRDGNAAPPSGERKAVYFMTTVVPTSRVERISFRGIIDDGAMFFVNGEEVGRLRVSGSARDDRYTSRNHFLTRANGNSPETATDSFSVKLESDLPPGAPIVIGVSIHNSSFTSSDLALDLQVVSEFCTGAEQSQNDNFATSLLIGGTASQMTFEGRNDGGCHGVGATKEADEPDHADNPGGASVWWSWQAPDSGWFNIDTFGSDFDTVLAVYVGETLDTLAEVSSLDNPDRYGTERIRFYAVEGIIYRIAVDGHAEMGGGPDFGEIVVNISPAQYEESGVLLGPDDEWEYLYYVEPMGSFTFAAKDPVTDPSSDGFFYSDWMLAGFYIPPPDFSTFTTNMHGFGDFYANGVEQIDTDIWNGMDGAPRPPLSERQTVFMRTVVFLPQTTPQIRITGIVDDGAVFYFNGNEIARYNMSAEPDTWGLFAREDANAAFSIDVPIGTVPPGVYDFAVSVHNHNADSWDLGGDVQVRALLPNASNPPPNNDFANADTAALSGPQPNTAFGRTHNLVGALGADKEVDEPDHAGNSGGGSVWWTWTAPRTERVSISTEGSDFSTLLAVYTGNELASLVEVASSEQNALYDDNRVTFFASSGTLYRVAIDGVNTGGSVAFGNVVLTLEAAPLLFDSVETFVPLGGDWSYLLYTEALPADTPIDPGAVDADFYTTWMTAAGYDGPAFSALSPSPLGYGQIDAEAIVTDVWGNRDHTGDGNGDPLPPSGERYATFFRTSFTPTDPILNLGFEGVVDDGAVIYVNGDEVARMNVPSGLPVTNWAVNAIDQFALGEPTEAGPQYALAIAVDLPAGVPVEVAVMVVNDEPESDDLGLNMQITSATVGLVEFMIDLSDAPSGGYDITWESVPGALYDVEFSEDLQVWNVIAANVLGRNEGLEVITVNPPGDKASFRVRRKR